MCMFRGCIYPSPKKFTRAALGTLITFSMYAVFVFNITGLVLNIAGFVEIVTGFFLNETGFVLNTTGFVLILIEFFLS